LSIGWKPNEWNYETDKYGKDKKDEKGQKIISSPKLSQSSFYGVPEDIAKVIKPYNQVKSRLGVLKGWAKSVYEGNKIKTFALTCACNTGRFKHGGVVNIPKADESVFFGKEMRSLFIVPEGYKLIGCDAAQLEARIEGHFSYKYDGGEYANFLLTQDIHQFNADSWGLSRSAAKAPGYALAYQCSPKKIQELLGCPETQARFIHKKYWEDRPALVDLIQDLEKSVISRGQAIKKEFGGTELKISSRPWIRGIDGRKLYVRSIHSLKNTLIQNAGMITVKIAYVLLGEWIESKKLDARICMLYHDEYQIIVKDDHATLIEVKELAEKAIKIAGESLNLYISLSGEAKIGNNWAETH
jgi:DNA polymerase I-like protein with 3'-5' exonuclease and polymerase domains